MSSLRALRARNSDLSESVGLWERAGKELGKSWERAGKELGKSWERAKNSVIYSVLELGEKSARSPATEERSTHSPPSDSLPI